MDFYLEEDLVMVQSITQNYSAHSLLGSNVSAGSIKTSSIGSFSAILDDVKEDSEALSAVPTEENSEKEDKSEALWAEFKTQTTGFSVCGKCGAMFMGQGVAVCAKCGSDMKENDKNEVEAKNNKNTQTEATSEAVSEIAVNE
jgi:DNA-directed RNA polymerase subunit M/transcription elongation factor TFIIS